MRAWIVEEQRGDREKLVVHCSNLGLSARRVHCTANLADCLLETDEDRAADDGMPDVELLDLRNRRNRTDISTSQTVPSVTGETDRRALCRSTRQRLELFSPGGVMGVVARVKLYGICAKILRGARNFD